MKPNKDEQKEVLETYDIWLNSYLNGDVKTYDSFLDDEYRFIGSTDNEDFLNKKDTTNFFAATADQLAGKVEIRNSKRTLKKFDELIFITDLFDAYFLNGKDWEYYGKFRFTSTLKKNKEGWCFIYQHFSTPDTKVQKGETIGTEQLAVENRQLREAVKRRTVELEHKNKELKIETALEKVRSRSMAMKKSDELGEVALLLFQQIKSFGINLFGSGFNIWRKEEKVCTSWMAVREDHINDPMQIPMTEDPTWIKFYESRLNGEDFWVKEVGGEELAEHYRYFQTLPAGEEIRKIVESGIPVPTFQINHVANFAHGNLMFITVEPVPEAHDIFKRFAKVFEQTYTRFLDLQKAEAQAREAQIEAALERVRSRTMGMLRSEELTEVASTLFQQVKGLGVPQWACGFSIWEIGDKDFTWYAGSPDGSMMSPCRIPLTEHPVFMSFDESRKRGDELFVNEKEGEIQESHYQYMSTLPGGLGDQLQNMLKSGFTFPTFQIDHLANFSHGNLVFITYEHFPEMHDVFKRFAKVFEQTYTRFLDLQKAEMQARESQIEAALEKVRSRSLAMQKADELQEVVTIVVEKLTELDVILDANGVILCTYFNDSKDVRHWIVSPDYTFSGSYLLPYFDHPIFNESWKFKESGIPYSSTAYSVEEKNSFFEYAFEHTDYRHFPDEFKHWVFQNGKHILSFAWQKNSAILIPSHTGILPNADDEEILKRFSNVFEQAYTRFLDLHKAEAQAREAQVEVALERVRSRAMAMQDSSELSEVISTVFSELTNLDFTLTRTILWLFDEKSKSYEVWLANSEVDKSPESFQNPVIHPYHKRLFKAWKERRRKWVYELKGEEKKKLDQYLFGMPDLAKMHDEVKKGVMAPERIINSFSFHDFGALQADGLKELTEENLDILYRFSKEFDITYTRFIDLKKAETQAREAQIELGLERVRARAMAMHHSDELHELVGTVFTELTKLDLELSRCLILIFNQKTKSSRWWLANPEGTSAPRNYFVKYHDHGPYLDYLSAWQEKRTKWEYILEGTAKKEWDDFLFTETELSQLPDFAKSGMQSQKRVLLSNSFNLFGCITLESSEPLSDDQFEILLRFAKVFDLTYTRFNDLQKAETQAREAQIEAALERVRSKALAMQNSGDLLEVANVLRDQMGNLGQPELESSIVHLYNDGSRTFEAWYAYRPPDNPGGEIVTGTGYISTDSSAWSKETMSKYQSSDNEYTIVSKGKKLVEWYNVLSKVAPDTLAYDDNGNMIVPKILFYHYSKFSGGSLLLISNQKPSDEAKELQRKAAKVFNLAYQRFLDLQQAEIRAKEAVKQSSLDRVRAEIASMRSAKDLQRITPIVWSELITLGVPFFRCGVFIIDENEQAIHAYLSTPQGKSLGVLRISFDSSETNRKVVKHWRQQKVYSDHWDKQQFKEWIQSMIDQGQIKAEQQFQAGEAPPESLSLHFIPFTQGMLYVGSSEPLSEDQIDLVKTLAEAFSVAYARYEDFKKLEDAKSHVENTLTELKAAQSQLIQSEKMASLGELTAGIAHEIQNPLNFVNNFSEVSEELIIELKEELEKGEVEEAKLISKDVIQNIQKINHHGQRASSIVKGMLEHSRTGDGVKEPTGINALAEEYLRLAYHGLRAKDKSFNANFKTEFDESLPTINVVPQDIGRVLLNLINNAFFAVDKKSKEGRPDYKPEVTVSTEFSPARGGKGEDQIEISIKDNGHGIPEEIIDKIFQPFFTTKPAGSGTGLGLSLSYDIVKAQGGEIKVETKRTGGTEFKIVLAINT